MTIPRRLLYAGTMTLLLPALVMSPPQARAATTPACGPNETVEVKGTVGGLPSYAPDTIIVLTETITPRRVGAVEYKPAIPRSCKRGGIFIAKGKTAKGPTSYTLRVQSIRCE